MFGVVDGLRRAQFHVEIVCELWPKRRPAKRITIGNIKILVRAFRVGRHPGFGQVQGLGALIEGLIVPLRAGEAQRQAQFLADSRIGADQADHAACNAGRAVDQDQSFPFCRARIYFFLLVVENWLDCLGCILTGGCWGRA